MAAKDVPCENNKCSNMVFTGCYECCEGGTNFKCCICKRQYYFCSECIDAEKIRFIHIEFHPVCTECYSYSKISKVITNHDTSNVIITVKNHREESFTFMVPFDSLLYNLTDD